MTTMVRGTHPDALAMPTLEVSPPAVRTTEARDVVAWTAVLFAVMVIAIAFPASHAVQGAADYVSVHTAIETFVIVVAMMVFALGWNTQDQQQPINVVVLSYAFLVAGLVDFAHMLSFPGMPDWVTPSEPDKAIRFWLVARTVTALAVLAAALLPWRPFQGARMRHVLLGGGLLFTALVYWLGLYHGAAWPMVYELGEGLTWFKIGVEYVLILLYAAAAGSFWRQWRSHREMHLALLACACATSGMSEFLMTVFGEITDIYNLLGHTYKIIAYYLVYRAIFVYRVREPYVRLLASQRELKSSEERYRQLTELSSDWYWEQDADLRFTEVSPRVRMSGGYSPEQYLGKRRWELDWVSLDGTSWAEHKLTLFARRPFSDLLLAVRARDGNLRYSKVRGQPAFDESGRFRGYRGVGTDVTDGMTNRKTVDGERDLFELISRNAPLQDVLDRICLHVERLSAPGARCALMTIAPDGALLRHAAAPSLPGELSQALDGIAIAPAATSWGAAICLKAPVRVPDIAADPLWAGHSVHLTRHALHSCVSIPFFDSEQRPLGALTVYHWQAGTTKFVATKVLESAAYLAGIAVELHRAENQLRDSEGRHRTFLTKLHDGVFTIEERIISFVNPAFCQITGYGASELIGREFVELLVPEDRLLVESFRARRLAGEHGVPREYELRLIRKDGALRHVRRTISTIRHDAGFTAVSTLADVTERKNLAEREAVRLRQLKQLSELGMLLSGDPAMVFERVVRMIGELFDVRVVCLSEIAGGELLFKAVYVDGKVFPYAGSSPLDVTPCATVEQAKDVQVFDRVMERFPQASFLRDHKADAYCGFPALDTEGRVVAVTCLLDDKPREFTEGDKQILRVIGQRIAAELERSKILAERKVMEERLRENEELMHGVVNTASSAIITVDEDLTITLFNPAAEATFGCPAAEAIGAKLDRFIPERFRAVHGEQMRRFGQPGIAARNMNERGRIFGLRANGEEFPAQATTSQMVQNGRRFYTVFLNDISEQLRTEEHLRLAANVFETSQQGIIITDAENNILAVNPAFTAITGYSAEEVIGRNQNVLKSNQQKADFYVSMWDEIKTRGRWQGEVWDCRKNGKHYCSLLSVSTVRSPAGEITHHIGIFSDITERKLAEEEVRRLNAGLEQRVRERTLELEASRQEMEAFSYSISHDLRAPLRAVAGFSRLIKQKHGSKLPAEGLGQLERIISASKRMDGMIDGLLGLFRILQRGKSLKTVDLTAMARSIIEELKAASPKRSVQVAVQQGLSVQGDPRLLRVALQNLLANAWKFTSGRSGASIAFGREDRSGQPVFFVRDNGVGFDPKYADKLFEPFQRMHKPDEFEGTGIGLATVQRIMRSHGGRVWAQSVPGERAEFFFTLPTPAEALHG